MADNDDDDADDASQRDLHVPNYSLDELVVALGLSGSPNRTDIVRTVDRLVFENSATDPALARFFSEAGSTLLSSSAGVDATPSSRIINVDSFYRDNLLEPPDLFTCTLSETLHNVTSISLLTVEIPQTWYLFSAAKGTNAFVFQCLEPDDTVYTEEVALQPGNYSNLALVAAVETALNASVRKTKNFLQGLAGAGPWFELVQDPIDGLMRMTLSAEFTRSVKLTWYDPAYPSLSNAKINNNLGWALGFRYLFTTIEPGATNTTVTVVSAASNKYLILKINDHLATRWSSNIVSLRTNPDQQVRLPSYTPSANLSLRGGGEVNAFPNAPRQLTSKQLYTISSVSANGFAQRGRTDGADTTDFFAKIPIKHQTDWANFSNGASQLKEDGPGKMVVETNGALQKNKRNYFGPVTLRKLTISLYDDRGNVLGLNDNWSFTLEVTFN